MPSVNDIVNTGYKSLESLTERELVTLINQTVSVANRRLTTLRKAGLADIASAATYRAPKGGKGRFEAIKANTKLSKQALKHKFIEARNFVRDPTSTVKGARKELADVQKALNTPGTTQTQFKGGYRYDKRGNIIGYGRARGKNGEFKNRIAGHENELGYTKRQTIQFWKSFNKAKSELGIGKHTFDSDQLLQIMNDMVVGGRSQNDIANEAIERFTGAYEDAEADKQTTVSEILASAGNDLEMR